MVTGETGPNENSVAAATGKLYQIIDGLTASFLRFAENNGRTTDCRNGCSFCCHQPVFASTHEISFLSLFLTGSVAKDNFDQIIGRARSKSRLLAWMNHAELLKSRFPCPLLGDRGECMAYPARPVSCRIYWSMDVKSCNKFFKNPEKEESIPNLMEFPLRAGRILNEGYIAGLKVQGYASHEMRIEEGILQVFLQEG